MPVRTSQGATAITGAAIAIAQLTTSVIGIVTILSILVIGLFGYIVYKNKKK